MHTGQGRRRLARLVDEEEAPPKLLAVVFEAFERRAGIREVITQAEGSLVANDLREAGDFVNTKAGLEHPSDERTVVTKRTIRFDRK